MGYISAQEAATRWGISKRRVQVLCTENRIKNATRIGNMWAVPEDAEKPADGRMQTKVIVGAPSARSARGALKKLATTMFIEIRKKTEDSETAKMLFVSLLATSLFCDLLDSKVSVDTEDIYATISAELFPPSASTEKRLAHFSMCLPLFESFNTYIRQYSGFVDDVLSWAYQYVNKISLDSGLENTQFFTEKYMIEYLTDNVQDDLLKPEVYLDPACGGGNFISHILEKICVPQNFQTDDIVKSIERAFLVLYGYELDANLAAVASANLKLKALRILASVRSVRVSDWGLFCPNIFAPVLQNTFGFLETDFATHAIQRIADKKITNLNALAKKTTSIYTNPPFQTIKGMDDVLKKHLKTNFPSAKCDLCNAFILQCIDKIRPGGTVGLVTQSSWLYLDSFELLRTQVIRNNTIQQLADLGSGAFCDLSGEKANVVLLKLSTGSKCQTPIKVLTVRDMPLKKKEDILSNSSARERLVTKDDIFIGERSALSLQTIKNDKKECIQRSYSDYGIPMQGTSTGNAAALIGYYWEHLHDCEWVPVSKGGSYSRWCGLNNYVLKWGADGEYIRETKGSALRNTKFFDRTSLVYSDTGTAGFNARMLRPGQLFVASGPGIRDITGNPYAHLALLNSRVFSYYLKALSPKLTVAAGYISRVPVPDMLIENPDIACLGEQCYDKKLAYLQRRPNNLEWCAPVITQQSVEDYAAFLFQADVSDELAKLTLEYELDSRIIEAYGFDAEETEKLNMIVGCPAAQIAGTTIPETLDDVLSQSLDSNCQIVRTRANKQTLGCDGILEYVARKENINPQIIAKQVENSPSSFQKTMKKYIDLAMHNIVLSLLGFRVQNSPPTLQGLHKEFLVLYPSLAKEWERLQSWIYDCFNKVHEQAFLSRPYYRYENAEFKTLF